MFNSIPWSSFITTALVIIAAYYTITTLLLYSNEIRSILKGKPQSSLDTVSIQNTSNDLMGTVKETAYRDTLPPESTIDAEELIPADQPEEEALQITSTVTQDALLVGLVAGLLQEIKTLVLVIADSGGTKDESLSMFQSLFSKYPQLVGTMYCEAISIYLVSTCKELFSFKVVLTEINTLWEQP